MTLSIRSYRLRRQDSSFILRLIFLTLSLRFWALSYLQYLPCRSAVGLTWVADRQRWEQPSCHYHQCRQGATFVPVILPHPPVRLFWEAIHSSTVGSSHWRVGHRRMATWRLRWRIRECGRKRHSSRSDLIGVFSQYASLLEPLGSQNT
jgi:hypothetical protein